MINKNCFKNAAKALKNGVYIVQWWRDSVVISGRASVSCVACRGTHIRFAWPLVLFEAAACLPAYKPTKNQPTN